MNIPVSAQTLEFLSSALLGAAISVLYDFLKVLRIRTKYFTVLFDALFWLAAAVALFLFFMTAGGGEIRIYFLIGIFGGALIYFFTLSKIVLKALYLLTDFLRLAFLILITPLIISAKIIKKIYIKLKNIFKYFSKWYKITATHKNFNKKRSRDIKLAGGGMRIEKKKSRVPDKNRGSVAFNLRRGDAYISPTANKRLHR